MSDGHQEGQDGPNSLEETTDASVTMQSDDSKADAMAILVMFTAAVAFCVFFISGWSFDLWQYCSGPESLTRSRPSRTVCAPNR